MTIKRIGIGSAFKVAAIMATISWLIIGLFYAFTLPDATSNTNDLSEVSINPILLYICGLPLQAVIGGLGGAFFAFLYNVAASWVGGVEIELEGHYMPPQPPPRPGAPRYNPPPPATDRLLSGLEPRKRKPDDWSPVPYDPDD